MANIFDLFKQISAKETAAPAPITALVVGLGNPGDRYFHTRHNAGFLTMDYLSQKCGVKVDRLRFHALFGEATIGSVRVLLMKPQTLMNNSGIAVAEAASFYKIAPEHILVISDDINLPVGRMRLRMNGSAGGQKGLKSIIAHLGSEEFPRLRMGVGEKPHPDYDLADWVLSEFSAAEQKILFDEFEGAWQGVSAWLDGDTDKAIRICNSFRAAEKEE